MSTHLEGKVALVTGGSRGIGKAIASRLAQAGASVIVAARGLEGAESAAEEIRSDGGRAMAIELDISDSENVTATLKSLPTDHAKIAILVNNAGVTRDSLLMRMKPEDWDTVIGTNLTGVYRLSRGVVPAMVRAKFGRIVNITSVVASLGNPGQANYCAAKAGIEGFSRSLAREVASRNITVNCIAPGFIDTDMTKELGDEQRNKLMEQVPLGRLGTPADIAESVLFLVGPGGDYVTGTTLHVNGGMFM